MSAIHVTFPAARAPRSPPHRAFSGCCSQRIRFFAKTKRPPLTKAISAPTTTTTTKWLPTPASFDVFEPDTDYVHTPVFQAFLRHKLPTKSITFLSDGTALIQQGNFSASLLSFGCCSSYYHATAHFKDDLTVCCQNTTPCGGCAGGLIGMMKNKQDFQTTSIKLHAAMVEWRALSAKRMLPKWLRISSQPHIMGEEHKEEQPAT